VPADLVLGLRCRVCGKVYRAGPHYFCDEDFGPLEVAYDYAAVGRTLTRAAVERRGPSLWRYRELLPLDGEPAVGTAAGWTPLRRADRLAEALGVRRLWLKDDTCSAPTLSYKDRVVAVALSKARELGMTVVGCSSTGNLGHALAAAAAALGLEAYVLVPADVEPAKLAATAVYGPHLVRVRGSYDEVNRLCAEVVFRHGWGFVNVNLRPFYVEGSRTVGFEIAEQLGWRLPRHVVVPLASGELLCKLRQAFRELTQLGLVGEGPCALHGAQPAGCNPIVAAVKDGRDAPRPVRRPATLCRSLAVGDPGDGPFAVADVRGSGGWAEDAADEEIVAGVTLLARTEGVFAEPAGGCVVAAARKLIAAGRIGRDDEVVLCLTGHGIKAPDAVVGRPAAEIGPSLEEFAALA
jgi:threonine synthase